MSSYTINLLPQKKEKVADKLLHFILYYFRYIIVITQIVVIGVFFFRFREDQKVIDLKQKFRQKQQILAVTAPIVDEAEAIHKKTTYIHTVLDDQDTFLIKLKTVLASIPEDLTLVSLKMSDDLVQINGTGPHVESIRALQRKLAKIKGFENAQVGTITRSNKEGYEFIIEVPTVQNNEKGPRKKYSK